MTKFRAKKILVPVDFSAFSEGALETAADLPQTHRDLQQGVLLTARDSAVKVDYDLWYPFQWYVRGESSTGTLNFTCFKDEKEDGWNDGCKPASESAGSTALLLTANHISDDTQFLDGHEKSEPMRNLLWFPESYRRPAEDRQSEGPIEELSKDFAFFRDSASGRAAWRG